MLIYYLTGVAQFLIRKRLTSPVTAEVTPQQYILSGMKKFDDSIKELLDETLKDFSAPNLI